MQEQTFEEQIIIENRSRNNKWQWERHLREQQWLKNGCNGFEMKSPISNPMSFWTEQWGEEI